MKLIRMFLLSLWIVAQLHALGLEPQDSGGRFNRDYRPELAPLAVVDLSRHNLVSPRAFLAEGNFFYLIDDFTNRLYKFDREGDLLSVVERISGRPFFPSGLAADYDYLYISDKENGLIYKISKSLDLRQVHLITLNALYEHTLELQDIYLASNLDIYLVDSGRNALFKLNAFGDLEWVRGMFGGSREALNYPLAVTLRQNNLIYVSDNGNRRVKAYDQSGEVEFIIEGFSDPRGLASAGELVFVCDYGEAALKIVRGNQVIKTIQDFQGDRFRPQDVAVRDGELYILDPLQKKILIYEFQ